MKKKTGMQSIRPLRRTAARGHRMACVILAVLALIVAPLVNTASHGPADYVGAVMAMAEAVEHGHSHDADTGAGSHSAIDHDHQPAAVMPQAGGASRSGLSTAFRGVSALPSGLEDGGLMRPPRLSV